MKKIESREHPYISPTKGEIPRIAWGTFVSYEGVPEKVFALVKDMNFNAAAIALTTPYGKDENGVGRDFVDEVNNIPVESIEDFSKRIAKIQESMRWVPPTLERSLRKELKIIPRFGMKYANRDKATVADWEKAATAWEYIALGFSSNPAVGGWLLYDEPSANDFSLLNNIQNGIIKGENDSMKVNDVNSEHLNFVNLYGCGSSGLFASTTGRDLITPVVALGEKKFADGNSYRYWWDFDKKHEEDYTKYLDDFEKDFYPGVWCSDVYAFSSKFLAVDNPDNPDTSIIGHRVDFSGGLLKNLQLLSKKSKASGRPFWSVVRSVAYNGDSSGNPDYPTTGDVAQNRNFYNRSILNENMIRIESFMALMYGAQGLCFWRVFAWYDHLDDTGLLNVVDPITVKKNSNGEYMIYPTENTNKDAELYDALKNVNNLIERYTEVFLGCEVEGVRYVGEYFKQLVDPLKGSFGPIINASLVDGSENKPGFLISYIKNGERTDIPMEGVPNEYIVILNLDMENEREMELAFSKVAVDMSAPADILPAQNGRIRMRPASVRIFKMLGM